MVSTEAPSTASEDRAQITTETQAKSTNGENRLELLPPEVNELIVKHLVTDKADETARDVGRFKRASGYTYGVVDGSPLLKNLNTRLNLWAALAKDIHTEVLKDGISKEQSEASVFAPNAHPIGAKEQASAIAAISGFLPSEVTRQFAQGIHQISDDLARIEAIAEVSKYFQHLDTKDVSLLVNDAIKTLADRGNPGDRFTHDVYFSGGGTGNPITHQGKDEAADAIARARAGGHLTIEHEEKIESLKSSWREASDLIDEKQLDQKHIENTLSNSAINNQVSIRGERAIEQIAELRKRFEDTVLSGGSRPNHYERANSYREISESIAKGFDTIRAEVMNSMREVSNSIPTISDPRRATVMNSVRDRSSERGR